MMSIISDVNITPDLLVMELGEGVAGETAPPGLAVLHKRQVMLLLGG